MIIEQDISQAEPDETGAIVVPAEKGPTRGWVTWGEAEAQQLQARMYESLGISSELIAGEQRVFGEGPYPIVVEETPEHTHLILSETIKPGAIPHITRTDLITDVYRKPEK